MDQRFSRPPRSTTAQACTGQADPTITVIEDLVQHARTLELVLADEVLTDILAKLHGFPVEEISRLR
jgi:hypothetical protein